MTLTALCRKLGKQIADELKQSVQENLHKQTQISIREQKQARRSDANASNMPHATTTMCIVPGCERNFVAKHLCAVHYHKARAMKLVKKGQPTTLHIADLRKLAEDGRKTRWQSVH